jgi:DNA repair exonuclease SbcCD ATPase subunit|tara:strand:+ start:8280 stop:10595 length:2316 start_codon:yes stop_codon:yes gene_type:complete
MVYNNPYIKVVWEDTPENFNNERLKRVKSYFKKKYNTQRINVITKVTDTGNSKGSLDVGDKILDAAYQDNLVKEYLIDQDIVIDWDKLKRLDNKIEEKALEKSGSEVTNKFWAIKWIEFDNFLSFGEGNRIDFEKLNGITAIDSTPSNFGGKTTLTVDLLLFLFFNSTTKSTKTIDIFNRYTDKNRVLVRGEVEIDGDNFIIERGITRNKTKKGDWTVKTELNFSKKIGTGTLQNLQGEQRRETESIIKKSIGTLDDFLLTILTTGSNLEELIEAKPTQRGRILTRFIGLEKLKEKELLCKEMYNEWAKTLVSNLYNVVDLDTDTKKLEQEIIDNNKDIELHTRSIKEKEDTIKLTEKERDRLISQQHTNIDPKIVNLDPNELERELDRLHKELNKNTQELKNILVEKPKTTYDEKHHNSLTEKLNDKKLEIRLLEKEINQETNFIEKLKESEMCPTCKRPLDDIDHQEEINNKVKCLEENNLKLITQSVDKEKLVNEESELDVCVKLWREYERNNLRKTKHDLQIKDVNFRLKEKKDIRQLWVENEKRLEENKFVKENMLKLRTRIDTLYAEKDNLNNQISNLKSVIKNNKINIGDNNEKIKKIKTEEEIGKIFKSYLIAYGKNGISKIILRNTIPYINSELNRLLSDSALFTMQLKINDRNELEFWMEDNDTSVEKLLSSGSGYERTIASLALRAVLAKVCSLPKPNVVCFDEVFGKVSDENLELVGNFFVKIKDYFEKIFVITHNSLVKEWCDNTVTVKKVNNVSKIN